VRLELVAVFFLLSLSLALFLFIAPAAHRGRVFEKKALAVFSSLGPTLLPSSQAPSLPSSSATSG